MRTSTSAAPVCLAALIARAISACVMLAALRNIQNILGLKAKAPPKQGLNFLD
jgi:hypothetical protein